MLRWKIGNKSFDCCHTSAVCTYHHNPWCLIMYNIMYVYILCMLRVCVEMGSVYDGCQHKSRPRKTFEYLWVSLFRSMMDDDEGMLVCDIILTLTLLLLFATVTVNKPLQWAGSRINSRYSSAIRLGIRFRGVLGVNKATAVRHAAYDVFN